MLKSFFEYYKVIKYGRGWSNSIKIEGLNDRDFQKWK